MAVVFTVAALSVQITSALAESPTEDDPCGGDKALLAILDRPTVGDSACVVPDRNMVLELGGKWGKNFNGGRSLSLPDAEFRVGIPGDNELVFLPPDYTHQAGPGMRISGFGPAVVGIKHELGYTGKWLAAVESLVTLPSGSDVHGSAGIGTAFNGIISYSPTTNTGLSMMLGVSSQTLSHRDAGGRFTSVNPDFVATWAPADRWQLYAEVYGQSRTSPSLGMGWNADGGVQYLVTPNVEVDLSVGFSLAGKLGEFRNYVSLGMGFKY